MPQYPLLLFPTPQSANRTKRKIVPDKVHTPDAGRQGVRLTPIFRQLQESFRREGVQVQQSQVGIDPEQVIIMETVGSVENFANAVKRISGLEWLGEIELDDIVPDPDFFIEGKPEKDMSGRLYLVMSNQTALQQMLSLWTQYQADQSMVFDYGLTKFRDVFLHLKDVRKWGMEDRLDDMKVFDAWQEDLEYDPDRNVRFEAELWYRDSEQKRNASESTVRELIQQLGGSIISQSTIPSIAYHSILGEIPASEAQNILAQPEIDLLKCDNIMFIRPTGQMITGRNPVEGDLTTCEIVSEELPSGNPTIAVLDGLPLGNHNLLVNRLVIDDSEGWASEYPAMDRQHGTAMTSLIVHGDLESGEEPLNRPVYVLPIMKPVPWHSSPKPECIPTDILLVDYIHRMVKRMIEGDGDQEATAPTVKIINLSIGDPSRHFTQFMSPLARLLDWLSVKYNIMFIISAGNHSGPIETGLSNQQFEELSAHEREELIVRKIYDDARHRRLLSPAECINGLTVGALHQDHSQPGYIGRQVDVFTSLLPSPVSAFGSGHRRSIKPDLVYSGGRVLYNLSFGSNPSNLRISEQRSAPGNKVAAPSNDAGVLDQSQYLCGSSNATALISRMSGRCYDYILSLFEEQAPDVDLDKYGVPLLKALIVHGCSWSELGETLDSLIRTASNSRQVRSWISRWIGFGTPDFTKSLGCNEQRATLLGFGELKDGEAHVYSLPLPPSLNASREWRKFTVSLAWFSPVASTTQRYRIAQLWFDFEGGKQSRERLKEKLHITGKDNDADATRRGTIQHEVFEGESAIAISEGDTLTIKVNCRKDAQRIIAPIPYGLVVSLEVAEGIDLPIYNEIQTRIATPIGIRPGVEL